MTLSLLFERLHAAAAAARPPCSSSTSPPSTSSTSLPMDSSSKGGSGGVGGGPVIVIAVTHDKSALDPAVLRPGRLDSHVCTEMPNAEGRRDMLRAYFGRRMHAPAQTLQDGTGTPSSASASSSSSLPLAWPSLEAGLVTRTAGWSHADLAGLWQEAAMQALRRGVAAQPPPPAEAGGGGGGGAGDWDVQSADVDCAWEVVAAHVASAATATASAVSTDRS